MGPFSQIEFAVRTAVTIMYPTAPDLQKHKGKKPLYLSTIDFTVLGFQNITIQ